jgi:hypothetical protein
MMPGDTALMNIHSVTAYKGFVNNGFRRDIVYDGTFFSEGLPSFGYNASEELTSDEQRKKFHLTPLNEELPPQTDTIGKRTLLFNDDADLIQYRSPSHRVTWCVSGNRTAAVIFSMYRIPRSSFS